MIPEIIFLLLGLVLIVLGADFLTKGSADLARRFRISELVVGLTVIAIGTSAPELVVSALSAGKGSGDMAIGNVAGSNTFNILVILGTTALIRPVRFTRDNIRRDIVFVLAASVLFVFISLFNGIFGLGENRISRGGGVLLLLCFALFLGHTVRLAFRQREKIPTEPHKIRKPVVILFLIAGGLAGLVFGGELFLDSAKTLAAHAGISDSVIAITLMAGGTSLPELASCIAAARRGKSQMALGNVIGSNISNILLVLGTSAAIRPLGLGGITGLDLAIVPVGALLLYLTVFTFRKHQVDRAEGVLFLLLYLLYTGYLLYS